MSSIDDRTAEEKLPQNKVVITFLRRVTAASHTPSQEIQTQALARVRSQLLEEGQLEKEDLTSIQPLEQISPYEDRESNPPLLRKRFLWKQRLGLLVAILCVALLTSSFVAVEQLIHHNSTTTGASSHNSPPAKSGQFVYFQIVEVRMTPTDFVQSSVVIHKGIGLNLVDDTRVHHMIRNGYWQNSKPMFLKEQGIPKVEFAVVGSQVIGPFNTLGTYHLFDAIHAGMNLTVIVQK